jgi:hypothetical protein
MQQCARKRGARIQVGGGSHPNAKCPRTMESGDDDLPSGYYDDGERITVAIHPALLECRVCNGPLKPPLFQVAYIYTFVINHGPVFLSLSRVVDRRVERFPFGRVMQTSAV